MIDPSSVTLLNRVPHLGLAGAIAVFMVSCLSSTLNID